MRVSGKGRHLHIIRMICLVTAAVLVMGQTFAPAEYVLGASSISSVISEKEEAVEKAEKNLKAAKEQYEAEKKAARDKVEVSEEELAHVGKEFIDHLVKEAYAADKKKLSGIPPMSDFTIDGCMKKAMANSECRTVINKMNKNASNESGTFEGMVKRALKTDNINKAITFMEKCNALRKTHGLAEYKVSPYLMAESAVASAIESQTRTHTFVNSGCFINIRGNKVYDSIAVGFTDPFTFWYDREKAMADKGETGSGVAHYKAIISTGYRQTGACWLDKVNFSEQSFSYDDKGTAYTTAEFRRLYNSFIKEKKEKLQEEKSAEAEIFNNKPDYLKDAESDLRKAKNELISTVKGYKPSISTSNYSYDKIKVSYSIPEGFDGIKILRSNTGKAKSYSVKKTSTSGRSYVNTGLTTGKTFYYKAYLYKMIDGKKVMSQYSDGVKEKVRPAKVSGLSARKTSSGKLKITWKTIRGASGYDVYVRRAGESKSACLKKGKSVRGIKLTSLNSGKAVAYASAKGHGEYLVKVRAYRMVNGKKVPGFCSKEFSVVL